MAAPHRFYERRSLYTCAAALLFCIGVLSLFFSLYHGGAQSALLASALLFLGAIICWTCSAFSAAVE